MSDNKRILFCNVGYLEFYDSSKDKKPIEYGGKYPKKYKTGGEINNFRKYDDGNCYGFVEPGITNGKHNKLHIEKIDSNYKGKDEIPDVTVVFCARSALKKETVIVGWYEKATVYRTLKEINGVMYNITANSDNMVIISEDERDFGVPRANSSEKFGFGISQMWYAKEDSEEVKNFVSRVFDYIGGKRFIWTEQDDREYLECGISEEKIVNVHKRNAAARKACLKFNGCKCKICGFESEKVYGKEFEHLIHVHHIKPISEQKREYSVDPKKDLIPVCPNCHMALHTKVNNYSLSPEELKFQYEKIKKESSCK